jgi:hypothetical protein
MCTWRQLRIRRGSQHHQGRCAQRRAAEQRPPAAPAQANDANFSGWADDIR